MGFFIEVLIGGLMAGVLYSLVALGFVLIFKASGVFNFAQGAMVLFAALTFVWLLDILSETFAPLLLALAITIVIMILLAVAVERLVLRPLVNQPGISLFMATLGIAYFLDGFGQAVWGSDIYVLDVGIPKDSMLLLESVFEGGILVSSGDLVATLIAGVLVVTLAIFFQRTRIGRALRAVADDHQAAQSVGIPLNYIWVIVWTVAGIVALPLDGSIQFVLSGDDPADAWKALTISTELADQDCGPYNPIWVDVPDPSHIPHQRLVVEAHWVDVRSWSLGEMDDEELSNKFQRSAYSLSQSTP